MVDEDDSTTELPPSSICIYGYTVPKRTCWLRKSRPLPSLPYAPCRQAGWLAGRLAGWQVTPTSYQMLYADCTARHHLLFGNPLRNYRHMSPWQTWASTQYV